MRIRSAPVRRGGRSHGVLLSSYLNRSRLSPSARCCPLLLTALCHQTSPEAGLTWGGRWNKQTKEVKKKGWRKTIMATAFWLQPHTVLWVFTGGSGFTVEHFVDQIRELKTTTSECIQEVWVLCCAFRWIWWLLIPQFPSTCHNLCRFHPECQCF